MAQDLRELFEEDIDKRPESELSGGHQARFSARLNKNLPHPKENSNDKFYWLKIAAILIVAVVSGVLVYKNVEVQTTPVVNAVEEKPSIEKQPVYLSDVSPEFKKVEDYYLANINAELAQLNVTSVNKELIDSFMAQLSELDNEYKKLNAELDDTGVNEQTVSALINNLELRLDLLFKLKDKLTEIKKSSFSKTQENKA